MATAVLDKIAHAALGIRPLSADMPGVRVSQLPLFATEFVEAQRDYPILFHRADDGVIDALVVLGFAAGDNLYLDGNDWHARYIPAILRKGPLLIGRGGDAPVVHIDLDHVRTGTISAGAAPLFLEAGDQGPALVAASAALEQLHLGHEMRLALSDQLLAHGLLEPFSSNLRINGNIVVRFDDYLVVSADRIATLAPAALGELNDSGLLPVVIVAAASLGNFTHLVARHSARHIVRQQGARG